MHEAQPQIVGIRLENLKPEVRSYVQKLRASLQVIYDRYEVKDRNELAAKVRKGIVKQEDITKALELMTVINDSGRKNEIVGNEETKRLVEQETEKLQDALNARAKQFNLPENYKLQTPEIPEGWTPEHLAVMAEVFGADNLRPLIVPTVEELQDLNESYQTTMYPEKQSEQDKKRGLTSYRPNWWNDKSDKDVTHSDETWGQAYIRSMRQELQETGGTILFAETIKKPNYRDGKQQYGSVQGEDPSLDPLLPIFKEVFGEDANRFNHSWDEIQDRLIPIVKQKLEQSFKDKGLSIPAFEVSMLPATALNSQMTFQTPENSQTDTYEWTSTVLTDGQGQDTGRRLFVGRVDSGGAARVDSGPRGFLWAIWGVRLAVVPLK